MRKLISLLICFLVLMGQFVPVQAEELDLYSDYYYMVDMDNGQVILDQGSQDLIYPASMTKMMTLIVALENIENLEDRILLDKTVFDGLYEANASMAGFYLNETVTLKDCLYGLFLPSGAETTRAAAFYVAGSEEAFVELMNQKAKELGMLNTHYVNTTGLHDNDHVTTLQDLAKLLSYCLENKEFKEIFSTRKYTALSGSMHTKGLVWQSTTFKNLERVGYSELDESDIVGGKTGYTIPAGLCLASVAEKDGRRYMLITAHAPSGSIAYHAMDAANTYSEILYHYQKTVLVKQEDVLASTKVRFNLLNNQLDFCADKPIELTLSEEIDTEKIEIVLNVEESYDAPISKGEILGEATLMYEGNELYHFNVVANQDIERNPLIYGAYCLYNWALDNLILTGFILFVLGFILWRIFVYRYELVHKFHRRKRKHHYYH